MTFAGYTHAMAFRAIRAVQVTCDPETDVCTSAVPHRRSNTQGGFFHTTGTLPGGISPQMEGGMRYGFCLEVLDSTRFKIRAGAGGSLTCTNWESRPDIDITTTGAGTHYLYTNQSTGNAEYGPAAFWSMTGYPQGTMLSFRLSTEVARPFAWNPGPSGNTRPLPASTTMHSTVIAKIPAVTPAGSYSVTVQTSESATSLVNPAQYTFPLKVESIGEPVLSGPSVFPPIPGFRKGDSALQTGQCGKYNGVGDCSWATWEFILTANTHGGGARSGPATRLAQPDTGVVRTERSLCSPKEWTRTTQLWVIPRASPD